MNFKIMGDVTTVLLCVALFVDGAFWYGMGALCVFYMGVAMWLDAEHKRRRRRQR